MVTSWRHNLWSFNADSNHGGWQQTSQIDFPVAADDGGSLTYDVGPRPDSLEQ